MGHVIYSPHLSYVLIANVAVIYTTITWAGMIIDVQHRRTYEHEQFNLYSVFTYAW